MVPDGARERGGRTGGERGADLGELRGEVAGDVGGGGAHDLVGRGGVCVAEGGHAGQRLQHAAHVAVIPAVIEADEARAGHGHELLAALCDRVVLKLDVHVDLRSIETTVSEENHVGKACCVGEACCVA